MFRLFSVVQSVCFQSVYINISQLVSALLISSCGCLTFHVFFKCASIIVYNMQIHEKSNLKITFSPWRVRDKDWPFFYFAIYKYNIKRDSFLTYRLLPKQTQDEKSPWNIFSYPTLLSYIFESSEFV